MKWESGVFSWMMIALSNERRGKIYGFGNHFLKILRHFTGKNSKVLMPRELAGDFKAVKRRPVKSEKTFMSVNGVSQQRVGQTGHVDTNLVGTTGLKL